MNSIRKKSFTLIELIIVVLIIFASYFLIFSSKTFDTQQDKIKIGLGNIKEFLLSRDFSKKISFICIEEDFTCFIKNDGVINKEMKFKNFFLEAPEVYTYEKDGLKIDFPQTKIDDVNYDVIFRLDIDADYKSNDFIVQMQDKTYVFNSIYEKPIEYKSLSEAFEMFYIKEEEVKDAF